MIQQLLYEIVILVVGILLFTQMFIVIIQIAAAPFWLLWQLVKLFRKYVLIISVLFISSCAMQAVPVAVTGKVAIVKNRIKFEQTGSEVILRDTVINCIMITYKRKPK